MIERLAISHFRGLRTALVKDLGRINILVGLNNTGKSSVLEALYLLGSCSYRCEFRPGAYVLMDRGHIEYPDALLPMDRDLFGHYPCSRIWHRHGRRGHWRFDGAHITEDGVLEIENPLANGRRIEDERMLKRLTFVPQGYDQTFYKKGADNADLELVQRLCVMAMDEPDEVDSILTYYMNGLYPDSFESVSTQDRTEKGVETGPEPEPELNQRFALCWDPDLCYRNERLAAWGVLGAIPPAENILLYDLHTTMAPFSGEFYRTLRDVPDWRWTLSERFARVFDLGEVTVNIEPHPQYTNRNLMRGTIEPRGRKPIAIDDYGDGARQTFKLLAGLIVLVDRCRSSENGWLLWEDPELFMHPYRLGKLIDEVLDMIAGTKIQVFVSTQSINLLGALASLIADGKLEEDWLRTFRLDLAEDGRMTIEKFWGSSIGDWLEAGFDPRLPDQVRYELPIRCELRHREGENQNVGDEAEK